MTLIRSTEASQAMQLARRLADSGHTGQAMDACNALIVAQPGCIDARLLMATLLLSVGRAEVAMEHLDAASWYLQHEPTDAAGGQVIEQLLLRGKALLQQSRPQDACLVWRQVLAISARHPGALRLLAAAYEQLKQYDQAIACVEHLVLLAEHRDKEAIQLLADLCELDGQHERALSLLEQFGLSEQAVTQWQMVRLLRRVDRKHEAMDRLTELCRQWPEDLSLALAVAELAGELGHEAMMLRHASRAMADQGSRQRAMASLATHEQRVGRLGRAGRLWWRLSSQSSGDAASGLAHLAVCATVLNRDRLVMRVMQRMKRLADEAQVQAMLTAAWLEITPGRLMLEQQQGVVASGRGGGAEQSVLTMLLQESAATLELQAEEKPGYADVHHHLAMCQWKLGQADRAAINSDRALHINGAFAQAAMLRAQLLIDEGAGEAALAVLNAALARKPDHLELSAMAGALEVMTGRWKQAVGRLTAEENKPQLRRRIGGWLERLGRDSEAIRWRNAA